MRTQDTDSPRKGSTAPRVNSGDRTEPPPLDVDRARRAWIDAVSAHPELQGARKLGMRRVALQLAMSVCYDPRLSHYGHCWPTVATLASWCGLSRHGVQKVLRRLVALGILTVIDRRPKSNLYILDVGIDPWQYCSPAPAETLAMPTQPPVQLALAMPTQPPVQLALNANPTPCSVGTNQKNQSLNQPECQLRGDEAAPSGTDGIAHSGAAQQALSGNGVGAMRETREVRYLRNLNIHAKDVYELALEHRDMAWRCMTAWGDEGGEIKGVLVERLRRIPEQAAEARVKAQKQEEEKRLKAAQEAEDDATLEAEEAKGAALRERNMERMALLSGAHQAAARQGAIERFREEAEWRWLYDAYRAPIQRAAASAADWDALPGAVLPRRLVECLAQALDALDDGGEIPVPPQDGDPPVAMGLYGPIGGAVEQVELPAKNGRADPAVEPVQACAS